VITVGETMPLGRISIALDPFSHGCYAGARIDGAGITNRDLQWATEWAAQVIFRDAHRKAAVCVHCGFTQDAPAEENANATDSWGRTNTTEALEGKVMT